MHKSKLMDGGIILLTVGMILAMVCLNESNAAKPKLSKRHHRTMYKSYCGYHTHGDLNASEYHEKIVTHDGYWEAFRGWSYKPKNANASSQTWEISDGIEYAYSDTTNPTMDKVTHHRHCVRVRHTHANANQFHRYQDGWRMFRIK